MKKVNFILLLLSILFITACNNDEKPEDMSSDSVMQAKSAQSNRYEAEYALLSADAVIENSIAGYSGSGYVNQKSGNISFKVNVREAGEYSIIFRYSSGGEYKENDLLVNGNSIATVKFNAASGWQTILQSDITLQSGENTITIKKNWGWIYLDYIEIVSQGPVKYEAEQASLTGGALVANSLGGYSGTGYADQRGGDITFDITVPYNGQYTLGFRYSNSNEYKENDLLVNGQFIQILAFNGASDWSMLQVGPISLNAGTNTVTVQKNWGWIYLDYMEVSAYQSVSFNIDAALVTKNPSAESVNLYNFLEDNFGKKTISGAMANYSTGLEEATWMYEQTGKWPALAAFDFINYTRDWGTINFNELVNNSKAWWANNGIVSLLWHWRDPLWVNDEFYTEKTSFDISKIDDTNSAEYKAMIRDIDIVAQYLKQLKEAKVPILWRPLHEASGKWFWWGAKGSNPYKKLWVITYDRMVNYHGLNNLIWVWTSEADDPDWYPGDDYVDIVGMDIYPGENQHGSQYVKFNKVKELVNGKKIIALSECGSIPDIDSMFSKGDTWSWFMPWNGDFLRSDKHNGASYIKNVFKDSRVITRDQMPSLK